MNIIITVIERRWDWKAKPRQKQYGLKKKVPTNKTRRLVFKAAFTVPGMTGMRIKSAKEESGLAGELGRSGLQERNPSTQAGSRPRGWSKRSDRAGLWEKHPSQSPVKRAILSFGRMHKPQQVWRQSNQSAYKSHMLYFWPSELYP